MDGYSSKQALVDEIRRTANLFIGEFDGISESDANLLLSGVDRTPAQMLAYQLGWMSLICGWDADELAGRTFAMPAEGIKWNQLGGLYEKFYAAHAGKPLLRLCDEFKEAIDSMNAWLLNFTDDEMFKPGGRKWASSTPSNWPIWKWIHINTVAPFKSFRSKIRKWKKLREA